MRPLKKLLQSLDLGGGQVPEEMMVSGPAKLSDANEHQFSFLANMKYERELYDTKACAVLVPKDFVPRIAVSTLLVPVTDPYAVITRILEEFEVRHDRTGIMEPVSMADDVQLGSNCYVGPFSVLEKGVSIGKGTVIMAQAYLGENVKVGKNCTIHSGVKIYHGCEIGDECIIHSGTVIGSDGFGYAPGERGHLQKVPQIGNVILKHNVEIGSNCSIDRATMGSTIIGLGVKLDNLIQVGHNVVIGNHTVIAAQSGVSGSTKVGRNSMIGGQVGLAGHLIIAPGTKINAKSGVAKSVKEKGTKLNGIPAFNFVDSLRSQSVYRRLPEIEKKIEEIEEILSLLRK